MQTSRIACAARKYVSLDYTRHMPEAYVRRMKRLDTLREFDSRLGAPKITIQRIPEEDYVPAIERPWEQETALASRTRAVGRMQKLLANKYFKCQRRSVTVVPAEKWAFFPGDTVEVLVGKDKGKQGVISHVVREANAVFVDGLHLMLESVDMKHLKAMDTSLMYKMKPLYPLKGQVKLVDPNDGKPCSAEWIAQGDEYVRVSKRTGFHIPLPSQAFVTYEYISPATYIESAKDTPTNAALRRTYEPKLMLFEDEVAHSLGLEEQPQSKPTYWY